MKYYIPPETRNDCFLNSILPDSVLTLSDSESSDSDKVSKIRSHNSHSSQKKHRKHNQKLYILAYMVGDRKYENR